MLASVHPVQSKCWQFAVFAFRVLLPACFYTGVLSIVRYADQVQDVSKTRRNYRSEGIQYVCRA